MRHARHIEYTRRKLCCECQQCGDFFICHLLFHERKKVFPASTKQYYFFQNLLILRVHCLHAGFQ